MRLLPVGPLFPDWDEKAPAQPKASQERVTNLDGDFLIDSAVPGTYVIRVEKKGYIDDVALIRGVLKRYSLEDQKNLIDTLPQVTVKSDGIAKVDVTIRRGGAIAGHVAVDGGGFLSAVHVTASLISSPLADKGTPKDGLDWQNEFLSRSDLLAADTDDRGWYRIVGLPEGKYRVDVEVAEVPLERKSGMPGEGRLWVYAPDALSETDSKPIAVAEGEEVADVDLTVPLHRLHSVSGFVSQGGVPLEGAYVDLQRDGEKDSRIQHKAVTLADGSYRMDLLPSGTYTVTAEFHPQKRSLKSITTQVIVPVLDTDVHDANLALPLQGRAK